MQELHIENILARYPDIIEVGLKLVSRQHIIRGKRIDLLFRDMEDRLLIVEVKLGALIRSDVGQISEYRHYVFDEFGTVPRGMLIGTKVSKEILGAATIAGCECLCLSFDYLEQLMREKGDEELLGPFGLLSPAMPQQPAALIVTRVTRDTNSGNKEVAPPRSKVTIVDILLEVLSDVELGSVLKAHDLKTAVMSKFADSTHTKDGILLSDKCYNITNLGLSVNHPHQLFEHVGNSKYRYLGKNYPYSGFVTWKSVRCGEWKQGILTKWENWPSLATLTPSREKSLGKA